MPPRKKIVWKTPEPGVQELSDGSFHAAPATRDMPYVAELDVGDLLYVKPEGGIHHHRLYDESKRPPPYPFVSTGWGEPLAERNAIVMYLGTVRTNEIPNGKLGTANRILRHVVGINGKKYLVLNWGDFAPLAE